MPLRSSKNPRDCLESQLNFVNRTGKTGHIALSFKPEDKDKLTDEMMTKIAMEYICGGNSRDGFILSLL
jgi:hypothetical protein